MKIFKITPPHPSTLTYKLFFINGRFRFFGCGTDYEVRFEKGTYVMYKVIYILWIKVYKKPK